MIDVTSIITLKEISSSRKISVAHVVLNRVGRQKLNPLTVKKT